MADKEQERENRAAEAAIRDGTREARETVREAGREARATTRELLDTAAANTDALRDAGQRYTTFLLDLWVQSIDLGYSLAEQTERWQASLLEQQRVQREESRKLVDEWVNQVRQTLGLVERRAEQATRSR